MTKSPSVPLRFLSFVLALITSALDGSISWTPAELWPLDFVKLLFIKTKGSGPSRPITKSTPSPFFLPVLITSGLDFGALEICHIAFSKKNLLAYWLNDFPPLPSPPSTHITTRQGPRFTIRMVIGIFCTDTVFVQLNQYSQILRRQCCLITTAGRLKNCWVLRFCQMLLSKPKSLALWHNHPPYLLPPLPTRLSWPQSFLDWMTR